MTYCVHHLCVSDYDWTKCGCSGAVVKRVYKLTLLHTLHIVVPIEAATAPIARGAPHGRTRLSPACKEKAVETCTLADSEGRACVQASIQTTEVRRQRARRAAPPCPHAPRNVLWASVRASIFCVSVSRWVIAREMKLACLVGIFVLSVLFLFHVEISKMHRTKNFITKKHSQQAKKYLKVAA